MSAKNNCQIQFHSESGVFFSDDVMNGTVTLNIEKGLKVSEISVKVSGHAKCRWTKTYFTGKGTVTIVYTGEQIFFTSTNNLFTEQFTQDDGCYLIPEGTHKMDFSAQIPSEAPSSYEGPNGRVRYNVRVVLKRPYKLNNTYKETFMVLKHLDLNMYPDLMGEIRMTKMKKFHTMFVSSGQLEVEVALPDTGFVPGQQIPVSCLVRNKSNNTIFDVKICLFRSTLNKVTSPMKDTRIDREKIVKHKSGIIEKGKEESIFAVLPIPAITPSSDTEIPLIITHTYWLKIKLTVSGVHRNMEFTLPIMIGTVPFRRRDEASTSSLGPPPEYVDVPPTYEEATITKRMDEPNKEDGETVVSGTFVPRYPVFQFKQ